MPGSFCVSLSDATHAANFGLRAISPAVKHAPATAGARSRLSVGLPRACGVTLIAQNPRRCPIPPE